jgi:hypothetical protein
LRAWFTPFKAAARLAGLHRKVVYLIRSMAYGSRCYVKRMLPG